MGSTVSNARAGVAMRLESGAAARATGRGRVGRQIGQSRLRYGTGEGELGMVQGPEQEPVGPESFALGADGSILVADVVNQRVMIYSSQGEYARKVDCPGVNLGDVMTDARGRVYVYDQVERVLRQFDQNGALRGTLKLNPADIDTRGYFHVVEDVVYFADGAARDVLVATLNDGALTGLDANLERRIEGVHGEGGRIYSASVERGVGLRVRVREPADVEQEVEVSVSGIVSARYVGEDRAGRFFVQTERWVEERIVLEVLAFNRGGGLESTTRMAENDYAIWTAKLVDVKADGTLVQFLPQREQAKLYFYAP